MRLAWSALIFLLLLSVELLELLEASPSSEVGSRGAIDPPALSLEPEPRGSCESVVDTAVPQSLVTPSLCERQRRLWWCGGCCSDGDEGDTKWRTERRALGLKKRLLLRSMALPMGRAVKRMSPCALVGKVGSGDRDYRRTELCRRLWVEVKRRVKGSTDGADTLGGVGHIKVYLALVASKEDEFEME
jgi:hypothetical protein